MDSATRTLPWIYLFIAGLLEIGWAVGIKYTTGFTRPWPSFLTVALMTASFYCLSQAVRVIPLGTAYAVWTGIGAAGTAAMGIILYAEPAGSARIASLLFIILGIAGLKLTSGH